MTKWPFLFSDVIYLMMCGLMFFSIYRSQKNAFNQRIWAKILSDKIAIISGTIFLFFMGISVLEGVWLNFIKCSERNFHHCNSYKIFSTFSEYLKIFCKTSKITNPCKSSLNNPSFGQYRKGVRYSF